MPRSHRKRQGFVVLSEAQAKDDAAELAAFIHDLELTREETVELLTSVLMGFSGEVSSWQVEQRVTEIAKAAMDRQT